MARAYWIAVAKQKRRELDGLPPRPQLAQLIASLPVPSAAPPLPRPCRSLDRTVIRIRAVVADRIAAEAAARALSSFQLLALILEQPA